MSDLRTPEVVRRRVLVHGLVQGVGFRPFVYRAATAAGLSGFVGNDADGVFVEVEGPQHRIDELIEQLQSDPPPLARIDRVEILDVASRGGSGFEIVESERGGVGTTFVAPDTAVCDDCLTELFDPSDLRYRYPFITCTNCGPRFTITRSLPYDRPTTTMAAFRLCHRCAGQYHDPTDRRFHAQPLACPACGPSLWFESGSKVVRGSDAAIATAQRLLGSDAVVAIKGIGGYHLACDATSERAVQHLRDRKRRPDKPLAVMVRDLEAARALAWIDDQEAALLTSPARPIVLLRARPDNPLAPSVAPGNPRIGILLPYAPLHHLLFATVPHHHAPVPEALVMTSGNLSQEPICHDDTEARRRLGAIVDAFLLHDREIHVPCDDSVARVVNGRVLPIRRARGYAPMPLRLPVAAAPILAVGGEIKNAFCVTRDAEAWLSQHVGDMGSVETLRAFERSVAQLRALYGIDPTVVATDLHPGYHTTGWAERADAGSIEAVQHHHAHLAALLAEHGEALDATVLGVVFDGTGFGLDGTIWGGELLLGGYRSVERVGHLRPFPLVGGDLAIRRPYRAALSLLHQAGVAWDDDLAPVRAASAEELALLEREVGDGRPGITCSSIGRLFDGVASLLDLSQVVTYEAQAATLLEDLATLAPAGTDSYRFGFDGVQLDAAPVVRAIVADHRAGRPREEIARGFHQGLATAVADAADVIRRATGVSTVGLTGGVFQNEVLSRATEAALAARSFRVLVHHTVPPNDGGLALGQAAVAAARSTTPRRSRRI